MGGRTVSVRGATVAAFREHAGITKMALARRAKAAGHRVKAESPEGEKAALHQFISRLERREVVELTPEVAAAIAEELGVEPEDLGEHLVWTWAILGDHGS